MRRAIGAFVANEKARFAALPTFIWSMWHSVLSHGSGANTRSDLNDRISP